MSEVRYYFDPTTGHKQYWVGEGRPHNPNLVEISKEQYYHGKVRKIKRSSKSSQKKEEEIKLPKDAKAKDIIKEVREKYGEQAPISKLADVGFQVEQAREIEERLGKEKSVILTRRVKRGYKTPSYLLRKPVKPTKQKLTQLKGVVLAKQLTHETAIKKTEEVEFVPYNDKLVLKQPPATLHAMTPKEKLKYKVIEPFKKGLYFESATPLKEGASKTKKLSYLGGVVSGIALMGEGGGVVRKTGSKVASLFGKTFGKFEKGDILTKELVKASEHPVSQISFWTLFGIEKGPSLIEKGVKKDYIGLSREGFIITRDVRVFTEFGKGFSKSYMEGYGERWSQRIRQKEIKKGEIGEPWSLKVPEETRLIKTHIDLDKKEVIHEYVPISQPKKYFDVKGGLEKQTLLSLKEIKTPSGEKVKINPIDLLRPRIRYPSLRYWELRGKGEDILFQTEKKRLIYQVWGKSGKPTRAFMFKRGDLSTMKEIKVSETGLINIPRGKQLTLESYFRPQLEYQLKSKKVQEFVPEIKERLFKFRRWGKKAQMEYRFLTGERVFGRPIEESYKSKLRYRDKLFEGREKREISEKSIWDLRSESIPFYLRVSGFLFETPQRPLLNFQESFLNIFSFKPKFKETEIPLLNEKIKPLHRMKYDIKQKERYKHKTIYELGNIFDNPFKEGSPYIEEKSRRYSIPEDIPEIGEDIGFPKLPKLPPFPFKPKYKLNKFRRGSYLFGEYVNPVVVNPFELFKKEKKKTKLNFGF